MLSFSYFKKLKLVELLSLLVLTASFFSSFIGTTILGYVFIIPVLMLKYKNLKINIIQAVAIIFTILYFLFVSFYADDFIVITKNFRFWLGVILYIIYFKAYFDTKITTMTFFRIVVFSVFLETLIINTIIPAPIFYNGHPHATLFVFYYRPLSFGANASMSSVALVCLFYLASKYGSQTPTKTDKILLLAATLLFFSGTGLAAYLLLIVLKNIFEKKVNSKRNLFIISASLFFFLFLILVMANLDFDTVQKFSLQYYFLLYDFKVDQINELLNFDTTSNYLLGNQLTDILENTTGDFGWLGFLSAMGLLGVILYFFILMSFHKGNFLLNPIIFILLIGTFHYPAAMSGAGQMIMAFLLTKSYNKNYA
jgi:hypothetical protein